MNFKIKNLLTEHLGKHFSIVKVLFHLKIIFKANIYHNMPTFEGKTIFDIIPGPNYDVIIYFLFHNFPTLYNSSRILQRKRNPMSRNTKDMGKT